MLETENYFILGGLVYVTNVSVMVVTLVYFFPLSKPTTPDDQIIFTLRITLLGK